VTHLKGEWGELFKNNIDKYSIGRPKRGIFIEKYLCDSKNNYDISYCLEQGAFSAKDSVYLNKRFPQWNCTATDNDASIVDYINTTEVLGKQEDAFHLSFNNEQFDLTFQSGLIVLFSNEQAFSIVKEQLRVTKNICFIFAHNKSNYIERTFSFLKKILFKKSIYHFRCYSKSDLIDMALKLGCQYELKYYDNMLINFTQRNATWLTSLLIKLKVDRFNFLSNEIVLVIHK
jgi:hypothetical protein